MALFSASFSRRTLFASSGESIIKAINERPILHSMALLSTTIFIIQVISDTQDKNKIGSLYLSSVQYGTMV